MKIKYNVPLSIEEQNELTQEYKEFCQANQMTAIERKALLEWVKDGNGVYNNGYGFSHENGERFSFLNAYRENEWIYQAVKGLSNEEVQAWIEENLWNDPLEDKQQSEQFNQWIKENGYEENMGWLDHVGENPLRL